MVNEMRSCMSGPNLVNVKHSTMRILLETSSKETVDKQSRNFPVARWKHASVVFQNNLYIMGGCSWTTVLKDLWSLDLVAFSQSVQDQISMRGCWNDFESQHYDCKGLWRNLSSFIGDIPPLQSHTMVAHRNQIYIFGGTFVYDARDCPLWIYSLEFQIMRKWKTVSDNELPPPRRNHSCSIYRDTMLIFGGFGDVRGSFGDMWAFDLKKEKWNLVWTFCKSSKEFVKCGPSPRHDHMAVVHNNALWIYGGMSGLEECYDLWKWSFDESEWTRINFRIGPIDIRYISNIIIRQNWVFYGINESRKKSEKWKYNFKYNKWTAEFSTFPDLPPHSTLCLSNNDINRSISINKYDNVMMRHNKIHPQLDGSQERKPANNCLCLTSCSTIGAMRPINVSMDTDFEKLTPIEVPEERYAYNNHYYCDELETTFIENVDDVTAFGVPKAKQYILLVGNNIEKASFETDIAIHFSWI